MPCQIDPVAPGKRHAHTSRRRKTVDSCRSASPRAQRLHEPVIGRMRRQVVDAAHAHMLQLYDEGALRPVIERTIGLDGVPQALADLEDRTVLGRIIVEM